MIGPPPRPWKMRATISVVRSGAIPERNELTTKSVAQIRKNRLRPNSPASHPVAGVATAVGAPDDVVTPHHPPPTPHHASRRGGSETMVVPVSWGCREGTPRNPV